MILRSIGHTAVIYLLVVLVMRMLGKRQIGDISPSELVMTLLLSEMAAISIQDPNQPLINGIIPVVVLMSLNFLLSYGFLKSKFLWRLFEGKSAMLVDDGKIIEKAMRRNRVTLTELYEFLRQQGYTDISQIRHAILESTGLLSIIPYEAHRPITPAVQSLEVEEPGLPQVLVSDGKTLCKELRALGLDENWLKAELNARGFKSVKEIFVLTRDACGKIYCIGKEKS